MKNGNVMGFRGYRFFSPKSSKAKYKTLGTSEANFGGKKTRIILREVRYLMKMRDNLSYYSLKPYVVSHLSHLVKMVQMRSHNIHIYAELTKLS